MMKMMRSAFAVTRLVVSFALLTRNVFPMIGTFVEEMEDSPAPQSAIPLIDLSVYFSSSSLESSNSRDPTRSAVVEQVRRACQDIGFFAIVNHGVDKALMDRAWRASRDFFDLPRAVKMQAAVANQTDYPYGYEESETLERGKKAFLMEEERLSSDSGERLSRPDLKETFSIGPSNPASGMPPRRFPPFQTTHRVDDFQPALEAYYSAMEILAALLLRIFAEALDLPPSFFERKFDHHMCALRILNYPTILSIKDDDDDDIRSGQFRAGPHTDYGALTLLKSDGPGLQVYKGNDEWIDVPDIKDAFIVNLGDLMQRWTNDKWVSTLHRVVVPPSFEGNNNSNTSITTTIDNRRQSMAFFVNMNGDAVIEPIASCVDKDVTAAYPTTTAGEHLMAKHLASMGQGKHDEL